MVKNMNGYYNEYKSSKKYSFSKRNLSSVQANEHSFLLILLERILTSLDNFTEIIKNRNVISVLKMVLGVVCFIAFLGILGSLELGNITGAFAVCASLLLLFIELLCIIK